MVYYILYTVQSLLNERMPRGESRKTNSPAAKAMHAYGMMSMSLRHLMRGGLRHATSA